MSMAPLSSVPQNTIIEAHIKVFFFFKKKVATEIITSFIFVARAESHTRKESDVLPLPTGTNFL